MEELGKATVYFRHDGKEYAAEMSFEKGNMAAERIHTGMRQMAVSLIKTMVRVGAIKEPGEPNEDSGNAG